MLWASGFTLSSRPPAWVASILLVNSFALSMLSSECRRCQSQMSSCRQVLLGVLGGGGSADLAQPQRGSRCRGCVDDGRERRHERADEAAPAARGPTTTPRSR